MSRRQRKLTFWNFPESSQYQHTCLWHLIPCPHSQNLRCFTLMNLASSAANVALIQRHGMMKMSLQSALHKHPLEVGAMISTLLGRLRCMFDLK